VDYGHRATPDVYLNAALATNGIWNSSQYSSEEFDAAFKEYQGAVGVEAQTAACKDIETILNEDVPVGLPYFYNYFSGHSKSFQGVRVSALGQMFLDQASQV
jgi:peptide/nickel transport system substrate-binding protein